MNGIHESNAAAVVVSGKARKLSLQVSHFSSEDDYSEKFSEHQCIIVCSGSSGEGKDDDDDDDFHRKN